MSEMGKKSSFIHYGKSFNFDIMTEFRLFFLFFSNLFLLLFFIHINPFTR